MTHPAAMEAEEVGPTRYGPPQVALAPPPHQACSCVGGQVTVDAGRSTTRVAHACQVARIGALEGAIADLRGEVERLRSLLAAQSHDTEAG